MPDLLSQVQWQVGLRGGSAPLKPSFALLKRPVTWPSAASGLAACWQQRLSWPSAASVLAACWQQRRLLAHALAKLRASRCILAPPQGLGAGGAAAGGQPLAELGRQPCPLVEDSAGSSPELHSVQQLQRLPGQRYWRDCGPVDGAAAARGAAANQGLGRAGATASSAGSAAAAAAAAAGGTARGSGQGGAAAGPAQPASTPWALTRRGQAGAAAGRAGSYAPNGAGLQFGLPPFFEQWEGCSALCADQLPLATGHRNGQVVLWRWARQR